MSSEGLKFRPIVSELASLNQRIKMAEDLGAAVLDMPNAFESAETKNIYAQRLRREQPDLCADIDALVGKRGDLLMIHLPIKAR